jgi:hypothetical protein
MEGEIKETSNQIGDGDPHEEECFRKLVDDTNVVCNAGAIVII